MKRMLFNGTQQEELRVAIVDGQKLIDIDIETTGREQHKSNIYKAVITRIEPSLEACFVNYGEDRHGFLPFKEVTRALFREGTDVRTTTIKNALREGQELMVQVEKEERGNKGAALTTFVSLAGRYLVLMPNNPRGGGVSRRVEGEERQELRETMDKLDLPPGMSVIARTAGIGRSVEELQWDLNYLLQLWRAIESAGTSSPGAFLIYHESSLVIRAIRDYFQPDIGEILVDTDEIFEQAKQFMSHVMPDMVHRVKRYRDDVPLFSRFQIEHQIETAYSRNVPLPSGGSIVIDHTEALVSIDVNSARSTRGTDIETTAFNTNCEAAEEAARQMRLRDLGGLIVIDFIDMESAKNQREIENRLKEALRHDRARVQMGKISRFGLMELSRQRLRPSLSEGSHVACPRCNGTGHIRDIESSALQVLRIIEEESMKENSAAIHVQIPVDVAAFLLNEKRGEIFKIESRHQVSIILIPNKHLETPHYKLERIKHDDPRLEQSPVSYELAEQPDTDAGYSKRQKEKDGGKPRQEAVVKSIPAGMPAPVVDRKPAPAPQPAPVAALEKEDEGFLSKLFGFFRQKPAPQPVPVEQPKDLRAPKSERPGRGGRNNRNRRGGRSREDVVKPLKLDALESPAVAEAAPARQQRTEPKPERQRKQTPAPKPEKAEKTEEVAIKDKAAIAAGVAAGVTGAAVVASMAPETPAPRVEMQSENQVEEDTVENVAEDQEQPRRRRRRGGRNRNRRDRDRGTEITAANAEAGMDELDEGVEEFAEPVAASTEMQDAAMASMAMGQAAPQAAKPAFVAPVAKEVVEEIAAEAPFCWTAPTLDVPIVEQSAIEFVFAIETPTQDSDIKPEPESAAVVEQHAPLEKAATPVAGVEALKSEPEPVVEEAFQAEEARPVVRAESIESPASATETPEDAAEPIQAIAVEEAAPLQQPEIPPAATAVPAPKPAATADLSAVLASAGLTMASTDPEKLRAAQARVEEIEPPKPAPRERRRPPPPVEEPLVQVDTRSE